MTYRIFGDTIVARIDRGEEIIQSLKAICEKENVGLASVTALGAVGHAVVGLYRVGEKKYYSNTLDGEMEMTALTGNVTEKDGEVYLHLHANFADAQGHVFGGHLNEAVVSATCEMFIHTVKGSVGRRPDEVTGLNLFDM
ncbi:PPC domain-containing DNA-binding protein [Caproiciproducens sp. CPB-2]|uniref:PPC domain-containing DNA-binding protein n=1 Tax=Caproiciproducens sp. CPB-2 TaxID=3030017 RepID=UPI0023D9DD15|nr:PPC domain-containing DNA-binding protein [Caproiciproducens sp. CPB-2]MDF1495530.1 DNA-binding protein [Caproiciproducens sp. CPB-2]